MDGEFSSLYDFLNETVANTMPKGAPFHSRQNPGVYHVCSKCPEGLKIQLGNRVSGTGDGKLCSKCKELQASGGC